MTETLQEFFDSRGATMRVDGRAGVIRGVKILGLQSRNGRSYLPEALSEAARLYEEAKVNVNHPEGHPGRPRDYRDRIGTIRSVGVRPGEGLFADFHFNPKHPLAEQLVWDAEHAPENVGFSHNVQARTRRQGDRLVVEAITRVQSVDLVADPATTRGLFESQGGEDGREDGMEVRREGDSPIFAARKSGQSPARKSGQSPGRDSGQCATCATARPRLSLEELRRDYPELVEAICAEQVAEQNRLRAEVTRLEALEAAHQKRQLARRLLREFKLPAADADDPRAGSIVSGRFMESLLAADDEPAMRELVRERAELVRSLGGAAPARRPFDGRPLSRDQHLSHGAAKLDAKAFVEAIT